MRLWDHISKAHLLPLVLMITWVLCFMVSLLLNLLKAICKVKRQKNIFSFKRGFWPRSAFLIVKALTNADTLSVEDFNSFEEKYLMVKYDFMINFLNAYSQNNVTMSAIIVIVFATE